AGGRGRRRGGGAGIVLEGGARGGVCFGARVVGLPAAPGGRVPPSLSRLGPAVLVEPFDRAEARRRAARRASDLAVGELLLDQQVVSGIGNIYRCEALFLRRINPFTTRSDLTDDALDALVSTAVTLMRANLQ